MSAPVACSAHGGLREDREGGEDGEEAGAPGGPEEPEGEGACSEAEFFALRERKHPRTNKRMPGIGVPIAAHSIARRIKDSLRSQSSIV